MIKQWTDVKEPGVFNNGLPWPYTEDELKFEFSWDEEEEEPVLKLDGTNHDELPYLSPDFKLNE